MLTRQTLDRIRRIQIRTRVILESGIGGDYHAVFKGRGMEFAEVREYQPGDEVRTIDWNVTARMGAPYVKSEHYPVFDCAVGERAIHYRGHVRMMGAIQPFISGAISKTVNLPETATIDDVAQLYLESWQLGVKAVAIDGLTPTKETVLNHKYPYARPTFYYTNGAPTGEAAKFLDFTLSDEGRAIVEKLGMVAPPKS